MTIDEHIKELIAQAENDFGAAEALYKAGYYAHGLFWAHLVLEKHCKALWVHRHRKMNYPYIYNLLRLIKESGIELSSAQIEFYAEVNQFQAQGRYDDTMMKQENVITKELCEDYFLKIKNEMQWLQNQMQIK